MNRKIVFILGAGASNQAGAPVMRNFFDEAFRLWKDGRVQNQEAFHSVFKARSALQQVFAKGDLDIHNIESVFAAFDMAKILGGFGDYRGDDIDHLVNSMRTLIVETIESTLLFGSRNRQTTRPDPPVPYGSFVKFLEKMRTGFSVSVITFNYDLGVDYAIGWLRDYKRSWDGIDYALGEFNETPLTHIPVLKLHGSLNWRACTSKTCRAIRAFPIDINTVTRCFGESLDDSLRLRFDRAYQEAKCTSCESVLNGFPVVVPPTWNKAGYHRELSSVWSRAASELKQAEQIVISGYSLPESDYFFRYLYALGSIGSEVLLRFLVFDPDEDQAAVRERYKRILGGALNERFHLHPKTFEEGISHLEEHFFGAAAKSIIW